MSSPHAKHGWRYDHYSSQEATSAKEDAEEQERQSLSGRQRKLFAQLALHGAQRLAEGDDLTVVVVQQQPTEERMEAREEQQEQVMEQADRMTAGRPGSQLHVLDHARAGAA